MRLISDLRWAVHTEHILAPFHLNTYSQYRWTSMVSHRCKMNVGAKRDRGRDTKTSLNGIAPTSAPCRYLSTTSHVHSLQPKLASCPDSSPHPTQEVHPIKHTSLPSAPPDLCAPVLSLRSWLSPARRHLNQMART